MKRWVLLTVAALAFLAIHLAASFTVNVNGDEFGLLVRAVRTIETGEVQGGGRPGLGTLAVVPFARDCVDAVRAIVEARLFWTLFVVAGALAFVILLRQLLPPGRTRVPTIVTALGLWTLAPSFLHYSVQLRTDQAAIGFGLWCGVALLASHRRRWLALLAGVLFGIGFLFSQKAAYIGGLVGVLVLGKLAIDRDFDLRREAMRGSLLFMGSLLAIFAFRAITSTSGEPAPVLSLSGNLSSRAFYAEMFGFRYFRWMLPTLLPQVIALGCVVIATIDWLRARGRHGALIATAWAVVGVGTVVFLFHTTRAPYFYLVMGVFPAMAGGLVIGPILERLASERERRLLFGVLWVPLLVTAAYASVAILEDTQRPQREALAFVDRNFPADARGFQAYSAFTCRDDPEPFGFFNYRVTDVYFGGPDAEDRARAMIDEFRSRPVSFMIMPTLTQPFPHTLRSFWMSHYLHYGHHVLVPGAFVREDRGSRRWFDVLAPGTYRWWPAEERNPLMVDGQRIEAGGTIDLSAGPHELTLPEGGSGRLMLDLPEPPSPPPALPLFQPWPSPAADLEGAL